MGFHRQRPPLPIRPSLSLRLAALIGVSHLLALVALFLSPIGRLRIPLVILVGLGCLYACSVHLLRRAPWSIESAIWRSDGTWTLRLASGTERDVRLSPATFVSLPLVVLNFRSGWLRWYAMPLFSDSLDPNALRRLRQRLRSEGCEQARSVDDI